MVKEISSLPTLEVKRTVQSSQVTKFVFQPLTPELVTTIGNTLRVLLKTQVLGWGIFAVKFTDKDRTIPTELDTLQGSKSLPTYIIFNLQELVFKDKGNLDKKQIQVLKIEIDNSQGKQAYQVTGKDIQGELEIINPEVYLTTMEVGSKLEIYLYCRYHWDSVSDEEQKLLLNEKERENVIFLSTDYCPVKTVSLKTANIATRNEKQLELVITTNDSISGSNSLLAAAKFLEQIMSDIQQKIISLAEK